jgi:adenosylcobinamide-GDP ribazoletransferase
MRWIKALAVALSTFTRVPMPRVALDDKAMRLSIAFLPLAGVLIGGAAWGWRILCRILGFSPVLFAAVAALLPVLITGGIHMDGYCDTVDALAAQKDKARALEILKDPHTGAFAAIWLGAYLLACFAALHELFLRGYDAGLGFAYILSRCFAAMNAIAMPNARKDGLLAAFTQKADCRAAAVILTLFAALGSAGLIWASTWRGLVGLAFCAVVTAWYRRLAKKRFGGATGDTTGYHLQITEQALLMGLLIGGVGLK